MLTAMPCTVAAEMITTVLQTRLHHDSFLHTVTLQDDSLTVDERYLGLHMPSEIQQYEEHIGKLADVLAKHIDLEKVLSIAATAQVPAPPVSPQRSLKQKASGQAPVRLAVARDLAFGFYYHE